MLVLKLLLTPLVIVGVTLICRRSGPRAAGIAVGLPLTTGPVSAFLAAERGAAFACQAASAAIVGLVGAAVFCATYARIARRCAWPATLAGAAAALLGVTLLTRELDTAAMPVGRLVGFAVLLMILLWAALSRGADRKNAHPVRSALPMWFLAARVVISTATVALVTLAAAGLGSRLSGLLSALPVISGVLGVFTHRDDGSQAAAALLRGSVIGCASGVLFCGVIGAWAARGRLAFTYALATFIALLAGWTISQLTKPRIRTGVAI